MKERMPSAAPHKPAALRGLLRRLRRFRRLRFSPVLPVPRLLGTPLKRFDR